jgi:mono/diheme cytochrome c family protein
LVAALVIGVAVFAETPNRDERIIMSGQQDYVVYCASCHGLSGKGDGPVAPALVDPLTDLTTISQRRSGAFPEALMVEIIDARRRIRAHGTKDMPVWGRRFVAEVGAAPGTDVVVRSRIQAIVKYLKSIQVE